MHDRPSPHPPRACPRPPAIVYTSPPHQFERKAAAVKEREEQEREEQELNKEDEAAAKTPHNTEPP